MKAKGGKGKAKTRKTCMKAQGGKTCMKAKTRRTSWSMRFSRLARRGRMPMRGICHARYWAQDECWGSRWRQLAPILGARGMPGQLLAPRSGARRRPGQPLAPRPGIGSKTNAGAAVGAETRYWEQDECRPGISVSCGEKGKCGQGREPRVESRREESRE